MRATAAERTPEGGNVTFAQVRRSRGFWGTLAALLVVPVMVPVYSRVVSAGSGPRNVILISIDTLRADHLSYTGYPRVTSPAIDRLAAQSLDFRQAFAQAASTLPSHASLMTALYPSVHGAETSLGRPVSDELTTLAEVLHDAGFETGAFVEGGQLADVWNLSQGFQTYDVTPFSAAGRGDELPAILEKARAWISERGDRPWFCFVHSYAVHVPYAPQPPYDMMFVEDTSLGLPLRLETGPHLDEINSEPRYPGDPVVRHITSLYDGEIRYMDEHVGRFLWQLDVMGAAEDTIIVFTSDHGEELGDHGRVALHSHTLYDELLHVPLLMRVPGLEPRRVDEQVRLIDVAPTLLGMLGIMGESLPFQGVNLLARWEGEPDEANELPVLAECITAQGQWRSLRAGGMKLITDPQERHQLFDVHSHPQEVFNLFDAQHALSRRMVSEVARMVAENGRRAAPETRTVTIDAKVAEEMRQLGYVK